MRASRPLRAGGPPPARIGQIPEATMQHDDPTPISGTPVLSAQPAGPPPAPPPPRPAPPTPWQEFTAWPGATSLITLLSAALLLLGLYGVIEPSIGDPERVAPRWQVLGTLSAYLGALLAGLWAMCRARAGNPDAAASAVVGAALAVGYGVVVHLLAAEQPGLAAAAALAGWLGVLGLGLGFARAAGGTGWGRLGGLLAVLYAWTGMWPVVLALVVAREGERMPHAGAGAPGTDVAVMAWWTAGWMGLAGLLLALLRQAAGARLADDAGEPFLSRLAMRWVLALVAALAAVIALAVQAHVAGLDLAWTDCLPQVALLVLLANTLAERAWGRRGLRDALAVGGPAILAAWIVLAGGGPSGDVFRGQGWAPDLVGLLGTAPGLPLLLAAWGAWQGWRRRAPGLRWGAAIAVVAAVLAWDPRHPLLADAGSLGALLAALAGWRARRPDLGVAAAATAAGLLPATRPLELLLGRDLPTGILAAASAAALLLVLAAWRPLWVACAWARAAAWTLGLVATGDALLLLSGRRHTPLPGDGWGDGIALGGALLLILGCAWRRRDGGLALAAAPAGLVLAWPLLAVLGRAWLAVWAAFALLASGVALALRRARRLSRP